MFKNSNLNLFLEKTRCPFIAFNLSFKLVDGKYEKVFSLPSGYNKMTYDECITYHSNNKSDYNTIYINITKKFLVMDTDDNESYDYLMKLKETLPSYESFFESLDSSKYHLIDKITYAKSKHFWFNIFNLSNGDKLLEPIASKLKFNDYNLDIKTDCIFENIENFNLCWQSIPSLPLQLYEILPKQINKPIIERPIIENKTESSDIKMLKSFRKCINNYDRFSNRVDWFRLGASLKTENDIYDDSDLLQIFDDISKEAPKYKGYKDCYKLWHSIIPDKNKMSIGTFYKWCEEDNIEKYEKTCLKYKVLRWKEIEARIIKEKLDKKNEQKRKIQEVKAEEKEQYKNKSEDMLNQLIENRKNAGLPYLTFEQAYAEMKKEFELTHFKTMRPI